MIMNNGTRNWLFDQFQRPNTPYERRRITEELAKSGDKRATKPLVEMLEHDNWPIRHRAAIFLGDLDDKQAVEPLIKLLEDPNAHVRSAVIYSLGQIADKRAVAPLITTLTNNKYGDNYQQMCLINTLGDLGDGRAVKPLIEELADGERKVRQAAAKALCNLKDKRAVKPLLMALEKDEDKYVRLYVENKMSDFSLTPEDCKELELMSLLITNILTSKSQDVRDISKQLLKKCKGLD